MEKKMETKQTNEVMHAAAEGPRHDVPTGWPEVLRTDEAIKLAYALEAAGYLNEDWKPAAELSKGKTLYVANLFRDPQWRPSVYPLFEYWGCYPIGAKAVKDDKEETPRYIAAVSKIEMPYYLQRDLRKHLVAAIYSHLLTENYGSFTNSLDRVQYDINNAVDPYTAGEFLTDHIQEIFEKILSEVAEDMTVLLCRVSQPIK